MQFLVLTVSAGGLVNSYWLKYSVTFCFCFPQVGPLIKCDLRSFVLFFIRFSTVSKYKTNSIPPVVCWCEYNMSILKRIVRRTRLVVYSHKSIVFKVIRGSLNFQNCILNFVTKIELSVCRPITFILISFNFPRPLSYPKVFKPLLGS